MFCNGEVSTFRCRRATAPDPIAADKSNNDRDQDWGGVYQSYLTNLSSRTHGNQRIFQNPLSDAFYAPKNLQNLRRGVQDQVYARTKVIPVLDFDRDDNIQELLFTLCSGNASMQWTTATIDLMNRAFVAQLTTNTVLTFMDSGASISYATSHPTSGYSRMACQEIQRCANWTPPTSR